MNKAFTLITTMIVAVATSVTAQVPSGSWTGEMNVGQGIKLPLVFNFAIGDDGQTLCTLDSPTQGVKGLNANVNILTSDSIDVTIPDIAANYAGRVTGDAIVGRFKQMGIPFELTLRPGKFTIDRPQTPAATTDYAAEEVTFDNIEDNVRLSGTLTWPVGHNPKKPVAVALMVSGSGQQNRDEEVFGHKPFLVLADYLARHGIATLRYDDRGTEKSTGDATNATTVDFAKDAEAGLNYLRSRGKAFAEVGVIGHSEGATIAFILAAKGKTDFIVSMGGPGAKGDTILAQQNNTALRRMGMTTTVTAADIRKQVDEKGNAWMKHFVGYDPTADIAAAKCPTMAISGSKDKQVEPRLNLDTIRQALPDGAKNMVKEYDGLNHLMQHCTTGYADEYATISETMAEEVMADIAEWINSL